MYKLHPYVNTLLFTILHFVVDGICATIIFSTLYKENYNQAIMVFFLYNGFAFLFQPVVGLLIDKWNYPKAFLLGCILWISFGWIFKSYVLASAIFLGLGNSFFHICGGKEVIQRSNNDIASLGIFVSTGAVGLMLGTNYYSTALCICLFILLFLGAIVYILEKEEHISIKQIQDSSKSPATICYLIVILVIVLSRAFVGKIIILDFKTTELTVIFIAISTCLGKMAGGFFAKYLGPIKAIIISMVVAIPCLVLWNKSMFTVCLGIFMFNFSMPITLYYANRLCPKKEGFAFGLLAAFLFPGYLLGMLELPSLAVSLCITTLCILSILGILWIVKGVKKDGAI